MDVVLRLHTHRLAQVLSFTTSFPYCRHSHICLGLLLDRVVYDRVRSKEGKAADTRVGRWRSRRWKEAGSESALSVPVVAAASTGAGTVRIIVKGRKLEVTESMRDYAERKVAHALDHYAASIKTAEVTLSARGGDTGTKGVKEQRTEVTVRTLRNGVVRSEETADTLYASIDLVCDKLERKLQKVKEIAMTKGKWPGRGGYKGGEKLTEMEATITESLDLDKEFEFEPEIIRTKYFRLESVTPVEAAEKLENLDHAFYVFRDKETQKVHVLYKRTERGYGLIIPVENTKE